MRRYGCLGNELGPCFRVRIGVCGDLDLRLAAVTLARAKAKHREMNQSVGCSRALQVGEKGFQREGPLGASRWIRSERATHQAAVGENIDEAQRSGPGPRR